MSASAATARSASAAAAYYRGVSRSARVGQAAARPLDEHAQQAALAFADALEDAYALLSGHPAVGTPRYAIELDIPGLRSWPLPRFPYVIFYVEREDHIDVWRVLHGRRDIPVLI